MMIAPSMNVIKAPSRPWITTRKLANKITVYYIAKQEAVVISHKKWWEGKDKRLQEDVKMIYKV